MKVRPNSVLPASAAHTQESRYMLRHRSQSALDTQNGLAARATVVDRSNGSDAAAQPVPLAEAKAQAQQVRIALQHVAVYEQLTQHMRSW